MQLTANAQALDSGRDGDTITDPKSKRAIEAVVTGPGTVSAVIAAPRHAAAISK